MAIAAMFVVAKAQMVNTATNLSSTKANDELKQPKPLTELLALPSEQLDKVDIARMNLLAAAHRFCRLKVLGFLQRTETEKLESART